MKKHNLTKPEKSANSFRLGVELAISKIRGSHTESNFIRVTPDFLREKKNKNALKKIGIKV